MTFLALARRIYFISIFPLTMLGLLKLHFGLKVVYFLYFGFYELTVLER